MHSRAFVILYITHTDYSLQSESYKIAQQKLSYCTLSSSSLLAKWSCSLAKESSVCFSCLSFSAILQKENTFVLLISITKGLRIT